MDDDALLESGDFARLLARYEATIVGRCVAALQGHADAEDVAQDVKVRLWRELRAGKRYPVSFRVVVNKVIEWTLRDYWAGRATHLPLPEGWDPAAPDPHEGVGEREALEDLLRAHLSGKTLEVHRLRYLEGLEIEEIAVRLQMTRNAVDQALHRGHGKLRQALDGG